MRTMYDSTELNAIPRTARMVAYYVDGIYATSQAAVRAMFPTAILVSISCLGSNAGVVGDVEKGCMTIGQSIAWVKQRRAAGIDPTLYVNQTYGWAPARAGFVNAGVAQPHWWVANYDGVASIPAGAVAKQYANPTLTGGHYDASAVLDVWPGVDGAFSGGSGSLGDDMFEDADRQTLNGIYAALEDQRSSLLNDPNVGVGALHNQITAVLAAIKAIPAGGSVDVSGIEAKLDRIIAELHTP